MGIDVTYAESEWTTCAKCHISYKCIGYHLRWWWINGQGPYCEKCMKGGGVVTTVSAELEKP